MSKKILIVDDNPEIADLITTRLKSYQYEVVSASNGVEGLEKVQKEKPDLIILDFVMPEMDGYEFVLEFKKMQDFKNIPIIMLTMRSYLEEIF